MRFNEDSFTEEITNASEAQNCYRYFVQNIGELQREMYEAGLEYEEQDALFMRLWMNLITACDRVGYTNPHIAEIRKTLMM